MNSKALWFIWFVILSLVLFASISISQYLELNPLIVTAIIGVIITIGAVLHFSLSGNLKRYPIESYKEVWKDRRYSDPTLYEEGIKYDTHFIPWDQLANMTVTGVDMRSGTSVVIMDKENNVYVMTISDIDGFKTAATFRKVNSS
jgi:hypothetical protein